MPTQNNLTLYLVILSCACLLLVWLRWRLTHPGCRACKKHISRSYPYCPWCALQQFDPYQVSIRQTIPAHRRASLAAPKTMPHKRKHTIVLPERSPRAPQSARQRQRQTHGTHGTHGTTLIPEPYVSSHVPRCNQCKTVLHEDDRRCWYCGCKTIIWQEKER